MMFLLRISVFFWFSGTALAQVQFTRVYGGEGYDFGAEVIQLPNENYLVAGTSSSYEADKSSQILLFETDTNGYTQWLRTYGGVYSDVAESMQFGKDGNLLIGGFSETGQNSYQFSALKLTPQGDSIWMKYYGGPDWDICRQLVATPDGGFALFGQTYSFGQGEGDFYLVRIDGDGDTLWTKTYGGSGDESGESIALANDNGFFLAGHTESFGEGGKDMYVVRTDALGDTIWTKTYGGLEDDYCYAVAITEDGGYLLAGGTFNNTPGKADFVLRKAGSLGNTWVNYELQPGDNYYVDVIVDSMTQNITVVGNGQIGFSGDIDSRMLRFDQYGVWNNMAKDHGKEKYDSFYDVKSTLDGGYILVGSTQSYLERFDDVWIKKTNSLGQSAPPELGIDRIDLGDEMVDLRFAPNPFELETSLEIEGFDNLVRYFDVPLNLTVFDLLGQQVHRQSIYSSVTKIDFSSVSDGIYSYQLVSNSNVLATGKLIRLMP